MSNKILKLYKTLMKKHGPQGWWPLISSNYHYGDYSYPRTLKQKFEISIGAILTQNTNWNNANKAIINLNNHSLLSPKAILKSDEEIIKKLIRPAGYYNQKYQKLIIYSDFFLSIKDPTRNQLLNLWGIGPETADSILLYAYFRKNFIIDTYTKRVFAKNNISEINIKYETLQKLIVDNLPKDIKIYQEFHALLVKEGKN